MIKNLLSTGCLAIATAACFALSAQAAPSATPDNRMHTQHQWRSQQQPRMMRNANMRKQAQKIVTEGQSATPKCDFYGTLQMTDGNTWFYTADYTYGGDWGQTIESAVFHLFDHKAQPKGDISCSFELGENETTINWVELNPLVTKKFFNIDDKEEFMIFVHATTTDYMGHCYTGIYQLGGTEPVMKIEGNQVMAVNTATDSYSENYTMAFEVENGANVDVEIYGKASYSSPNRQAEKIHTFSIPMAEISGTDYFMPFLMNKHNNKMYYVLPHYAKEFFDPTIGWNEEPVAQPDNSLLIDLYDSDFNLIKTTTIPVEARGGYIYTMPQMGDLMYTDDISWGQFTTDGNPAYIISFANYVNTNDSFLTDYEVYDWDGNFLLSLGSDIQDRMQMSDVEGEPTQFCFLQDDAMQGLSYNFVDIPSGERRLCLPIEWGENLLSTSMDRVKLDGQTQYAFSLSMGEYVDEAETEVAHSFAWFDTEGNNTRVDKVNMGPGIFMVNPLVTSTVLDKYFYTTNDKMAYMTLVKYSPTGESTEIQEQLRVTDVDGNKLMEFTPRQGSAGEETLSYINVINSQTEPALLITYRDDDWKYYTEYVSLPLEAFEAGGDGTSANPWMISTYGDLRQINRHPAGHFRVANDFDANGYTFVNSGDEFTGTFDGDGHAISNLTIEGNGLFSYISGENAFVKNLYLNHPTLIPSNEDAGFIAGMTVGGPTLENIHLLYPSVQDSRYDSSFGCIVGMASTNTSITGCSVQGADINLPKASVGGIAGKVRTGTVVNACAFQGDIKTLNGGGIAGATGTGDETIKNCHVSANIDGNSNIGGIIGEAERTNVTNCYVEGSLKASNSKDPAVGGIVGYLEPTSDAEALPVITNNIVALSSIEFNSNATKKTAHRIVGHSSLDEDGEIDWENEYWENNPDYNNPAEWPRIAPEPENGLAGNYAVGLAMIDENAEDTDTSIEGKSIDSFDDQLLSTLGFGIGNDYDTPWAHTYKLCLYYEDGTFVLVANNPTISMSDGETATISFEVVGNPGGDVNIILTSSDEEIVSVEDKDTDNNGNIFVTLKCHKEGTATITADVNGYKAYTVVTATSGIEEVVSDNATLQIGYANGTVTAQGASLTVYTLSGSVVAKGRDTLSVKHLAPGIYIVEATDIHGRTTRKIVK